MKRTTLEDWVNHYDLCPTCRPHSPCAAGAIILSRAIDDTAEAIAPAPMEIIDLEAHQRECKRCNGMSLCHIARDIARRAGDAIRETNRKMVRA